MNEIDGSRGAGILKREESSHMREERKMNEIDGSRGAGRNTQEKENQVTCA